MRAKLSPDVLKRIDAYWRAASDFSVGQIYFYDNPLLREPLEPEHVKPRLLCHGGTSPDQVFSTSILIEHRNFITTYGHDLPEIVEWRWEG